MSELYKKLVNIEKEQAEIRSRAAELEARLNKLELGKSTTV